MRGLFAAGIAAMWAVSGVAEGALSYNRDVRPILANHCFACHGPDKAQRKAGLRLDHQEDAYADRDGKKAIVPGDPEHSLAIQRMLSKDPDEQMPPPDSGKDISPAQIEILRRWIAEGGTYEAHWAYIPPVSQTPPAVKKADWPRNAIDNFILATLELNAVAPSPEADKATLARRVCFDLTGLPPAPEALDAFLNDARPDAYERFVDTLLASPQYGERMAVDWLDIVRYADTNGYHSDEDRSVYPYRDYVINSFNANKPYDQFTIEQLAGDLLTNATREQRIASAYNRLNQVTAEGGAQAKEYIEKYAADRVRTTSNVWLGSTMACSQCHDHKYDPYTMHDFYSFASFFADVEEVGVYPGGSRWEPVLELPTKDQEIELARLDTGITDAQRLLDTPTDALAQAQRLWEAETLNAIKSNAKRWTAAAPASVNAKNGTQLKALDDASILAGGSNPDQEVYEVELKTDLTNITGVRLEALPDSSLPNGLGRGNGNFVLSGVEIRDGDKPLRIESAAADYEQSGWPIANALDADPNTGWAVDGHVADKKNQPRQAVFRLAQPFTGGPGTSLKVVLRQETGISQHTIGHFRLTLTTELAPQLDGVGPAPADILVKLLIEPAGRTEEMVTALAKYYRSIAPALQGAREQVATLTKQRDELKKQIPYVLTTKSVPPRTVRVLPRGNWMDESGEVVNPATPQFLPAVERSTPDKRLSRLDLAKWITSKENPLTARVYVNRLWALYFGQGISKILDDFGIQGEWPTHPELLDWLAVEFMNSGWDVKHMVRLIVTSSTYRQSSVARHDLDDLDPYNRLLARQSRFRLQAEFVRDNALEVAGLLSAKIGGPTVKPYQPDGYYNDCNTFRGPIIYDTAQGEDQYRRGLYTYWKRSFPHPSMLAFDAPSREECTAVRPASNTPLQALVLLNDPSYVEAARAFAARILKEGGADTTSRVKYAFHRALGRAVTEKEMNLLTELLAKHAQEYAADPKSAADLLAVGQAPLPADIPPADLAAWTSVARAILNLHETITRS